MVNGKEGAEAVAKLEEALCAHVEPSLDAGVCVGLCGEGVDFVGGGGTVRVDLDDEG